MKLSLTSENLDLDKLKGDADVFNVRLSKAIPGHNHLYPTGKPGAKFTAEEEERITKALKVQGFSVTKKAVNRDFTLRILPPGGGFRIYGWKEI